MDVRFFTVQEDKGYHNGRLFRNRFEGPGWKCQSVRCLHPVRLEQ